MIAVALAVVMLACPTEATPQSKDDVVKCLIIYVPTPQPVVDKMLDMAKVTDKDVVYDLGCGDGRVVATAAKKYGAKGVGVDIEPKRIEESLATVKKLEVEKLVEIRQGDALKVKDLEKATVVMLYMLDEFMGKLEPIAKERLRKGTRIVAHDFRFPNWEPEETVEFMGPERVHNLYYYTVK
jgi:ubiquinone/menaquinone biosynthesis C-methylase UbiE